MAKPTSVNHSPTCYAEEGVFLLLIDKTKLNIETNKLYFKYYISYVSIKLTTRSPYISIGSSKSSRQYFIKCLPLSKSMLSISLAIISTR